MADIISIFTTKSTPLINMRLVFTIALLFLATFSIQAQTPSVEKSIFSIQTGFLGFWASNESSLSRTFTIKSEIGFQSEISYYSWMGSNSGGTTNVAFIPEINIEPRWYYNLDKRESMSKPTSKNSGNFITVRTAYIPNWGVISNREGIDRFNQICLIPKWGIRRNFGKYFNFETGAGAGVGYILKKTSGYDKNELAFVVDLHLRIGVNF